MTAALTAADIRVGGTYRGKKPRMTGYAFHGCAQYNDRNVLWISPLRDKVQYDGPAVRIGAHYPTVPMDKFLAWAGSEVKDVRN